MGAKWSEAKPAEKMLALYSMLMVSSRALSLHELALKLDCSKATVSRLLNQLEGSHYGKLIQEKRGREAYYRLDKPKRPPVSAFNAESLAQMAQWQQLLLHLLPKGMHNLANVNVPSAGNKLHQMATLSDSLSKGSIDYGPFESILDTILNAIADRLVCKIEYKAQRNRPVKSYSFAPIRLLSYHECIYIMGYKVTEEEPAALVYENELRLALQRFASCTLTDRSAPALEVANAPLSSALGIMTGEPFEVAVCFAPSAATYAAERVWSSNQYVEEQEDGSIILHIIAQSEAECIAWVLGFGPDAYVKSPLWLRKKIRGHIEKMRALY